MHPAGACNKDAREFLEPESGAETPAGGLTPIYVSTIMPVTIIVIRICEFQRSQIRIIERRMENRNWVCSGARQRTPESSRYPKNFWQIFQNYSNVTPSPSSCELCRRSVMVASIGGLDSSSAAWNSCPPSGGHENALLGSTSRHTFRGTTKSRLS